uniref:Cell division protein FtsA n=1 Tax=candidate division WOR-3 bacterium TaxID=2052148 RepID=A0A7V4E4I9_UNCW3
MGETFVVVDFCSSKIVTFIAEANNELKIKFWGNEPVDSDTIRQGQVYNLENIAIKVRKTLNEFAKKSKFEPSRVFISFADPEAEFITSIGMAACGTPENPAEISEKHIEQAIKNSYAIKIEEGRSIAQAIPVRFNVDSKTDIKNPKGMLGVRLEVESALITAKKSSLLNYKKALEKTGLIADGFIYQIVAQLYELTSKEEKENGVLLIDIGRDLTNYGVIAENKLLFAETLPVGGMNINKDLKHYFGVTLDKAEELKIFYGRDEYDDEQELDFLNSIFPPGRVSRIKGELVVQYITERLTDIFEYIKEKLIQNDLKDKITFVKITGGTSEIEYIDRIAENVFNITTEIYRPNEELEELLAQNNIPPSNRLSSSLGALLFAYKKLTSNQNSSEVKIVGNVKGFLRRIFGS